MSKVASLSFDTLRMWNGEQSRAFEELSFQLLKDHVPPGTRATRTGNPDGGVEWYATLPDGTEWGWQAKHVKGIEVLLTAMTNSVKRVAKERPDLRKLTFVISRNLSTGNTAKRGRKQKSQRQKYQDKIKSWQRTIHGADKITFELVQESDLLNELAKPEHNGRRWFWWDDLVLGRDWLRKRYQEQSAAASQKYRPDLQVDVPIQDDLLALGFDRSMLDAFDRLRRDVVSAADDLHLSLPKDDDEPVSALYRAILDTAAALKATASALTLQAGDPPEVLDPFVQRLSACSQAIGAAQDNERRLATAWRALPDHDPGKAKKPPEHAYGYSVHELGTGISALLSWLGSSSGRAFRHRAYFLTGQAGSGKTHLYLDATRRALDAGRPAVFLAGARFGTGNLWGSIADQLGLDAVGADVLLRAMDASGEAVSPFGSRFVIFVDALNETVPADFWRIHLPMLRAAIAPYPHVALAVSCRDTYTDLVLEGAEESHYVRRSHPGFAEREIEATQRYFSHYGLEAPKIPLLTPEFTLPLFLRLYCESLSQTDASRMPEGHQGRIAIFERYLAAKITTVARRFRPDAGSGYELTVAKTQLGGVIDALLDKLSNLGRESMSAGDAEAVARASLGSSGVDAARIIGLLQDEGVLTRERLDLGNGRFDEGVRIVFQAFADFLLLKRRLARSADPVNDQALKSWLANDCSWGISEAATILFPEVYGVELPDLLDIRLPAGPWPDDDPTTWERHHRARQLYRSLVENLPYRDSRAIFERTIALLNDAQRCLSRDEFYSGLFTLAPQPGNRLNGDRLHRYLLQRQMPQRDSDFGFATYRALSDSFSPATRLARWAAAGPYPTYNTEVIELACIPLCWLLSSPNRFMRDWVTKALVQLLRGHLDVMRGLVTRFWPVDDPYVVQRVVAIAYGSLLRSAPSQADQAKMLAELVHALVFTRPIRPDELLLDAARGIVRWAVAHQLLPHSAVVSSQRPYGLKAPGAPPSETAIDAKYGWRKDQPYDESYSSITGSVLSMGDFGRYVVESGVHHFSRYRIGRDYPERQSCGPRFVKSRWRTFVASLSDEQQRTLGDLLREPEGLGLSTLYFPDRGDDDPFTETQRALLDKVFVHPKSYDDVYPASRARRWAVRRTISLGWTPKLFGHEDRNLGHDLGREDHKAERWGKKYQWMAYHELLARVADNYQASRRYGEAEPYEGLHQICADREIDPSLPPIDFRAFDENDGGNSAAWDPPLIRLQEWPPSPLDFSRYRGDVKRFLADAESEPTVARSLFVRDDKGSDWVVLDGYVIQTDPLAHKGWRGLQQRSSVHTVFVAAGDAPTLLATLADEPDRELWDLVERTGHTDCCYVGEVGRVGPNCPYRHDVLRPTTVGEGCFATVHATERYMWEGNILDCSISKSATTVLPSTFIQQAAGLTLDMRGPSWVDAMGTPLFTYYEEPGNSSHALLAQASFLKDFLATHDLGLIVLHWFERMRLSGDHREEHPHVDSTINARLGPDLAIHEGKPRKTVRGRT